MSFGGPVSTPFSELFADDEFVARHIGPRPEDLLEMLSVIGVDSIGALIDDCRACHNDFRLKD